MWAIRGLAICCLAACFAACENLLSFEDKGRHAFSVRHGSAEQALPPEGRWDRSVYNFCRREGIAPTKCAAEYQRQFRGTKARQSLKRARDAAVDVSWMGKRRMVLVLRAYPKRSKGKLHVYLTKVQLMLASVYSLARSLSRLAASTMKLQLILMADQFESDDEKRWMGPAGVFETFFRLHGACPDPELMWL